MPGKFKPARNAPIPSTISAVASPGQTKAPDTALSGAFLSALGSSPAKSEFNVAGHKASDLARAARKDHVPSTKGQPARPGHIGPRSGHK